MARALHISACMTEILSAQEWPTQNPDREYINIDVATKEIHVAML